MDSSIFVAYAGLGLMAVLPIYFGSFASLRESKKEESETLSRSDAYWFPVIGSCVLFGFYLLFTFFGKEYINYLLTAYFAMFGAFSVGTLLTELIDAVVPARLASRGAHRLRLENGSNELVFSANLTWTAAVAYVLSALFTAYYVYSKHWVASNLFGLAFAISAIRLIQLDSFATGIVLLSGLFVYDVFWVFGTNVMVKVAKSFDVPVKLLFPKNVFASSPAEFAMLGLGDIVIPGVFVALCLRFDEFLAMSPAKKPAAVAPISFAKPYFYACYVAYILGLITTVVVMHNFKAAQPALLYLSPACILSALGMAAAKGQLKHLFAYKSEDGVEGKTDGGSANERKTPKAKGSQSPAANGGGGRTAAAAVGQSGRRSKNE